MRELITLNRKPYPCPGCPGIVPRDYHSKGWFFCRPSCERKFDACCHKIGQDPTILKQEYRRLVGATRSSSCDVFDIEPPKDLGGPMPPYFDRARKLAFSMISDALDAELAWDRNKKKTSAEVNLSGNT
jgi:hypothetical protein